MTLSVSIIGGGIGGLTLAHGLRRRGVNVRVFERDQSKTERLQGYWVHLSPKGCQALHDCLPPELYQRFLATTGRSNSSLGFYDKNLRELLVVVGGTQDRAGAGALRRRHPRRRRPAGGRRRRRFHSAATVLAAGVPSGHRRVRHLREAAVDRRDDGSAARAGGHRAVHDLRATRAYGFRGRAPGSRQWTLRG